VVKESDPLKVQGVRNISVPESITWQNSWVFLISTNDTYLNILRKLVLCMIFWGNILLRWTEDHAIAFASWKEALCSFHVLAHFKPPLPILIYTDASFICLGCIHSQTHGPEERVVSYASKKLKNAEVRYSSNEKTLAALVYAIRH